MRKFLLATTAAAVVLTLTGRVFAETNLQLLLRKSITVIDQPQTTGQGSGQSSAESRKTRRTGREAHARRAFAAQPATERTGRDQASASTCRASRTAPACSHSTGAAISPRFGQRDGKAQPQAAQAAGFLAKVAADGLDPADYPAPKFDNADPAKLAADELTMTNSVLTFARHASIGRVAFTRVSGAVYFDQKAPDAAEVLGKLADSTDVRATLDAFNPQHPAYKALKAQLAAARSGKVLRDRQQPRSGEGRRLRPGKKPRRTKRKSKSAKDRRAGEQARRGEHRHASSPTSNAGAGCRTISAMPT